MRRKAQFMEIDMLVAVVILIAGALLLKSLFIHVYDSPQVDRYSFDVTTYVNTQTVGSLDLVDIADIEACLTSNAYTGKLHYDMTIARQATEMLIETNNAGFECSEMLLNRSIEQLLPREYDFQIAVNSNGRRYMIRNGTTELSNHTSRSQVLLTGLQVNKAILGFGGSAYLTKAKGERSEYGYFGGFVGEGNISITMTLSPYDSILSVYLEGDFHDDFDVTINNIVCQSISVVNPDPFTRITQADLSLCNQSFTPGDNTVNITFLGNNLEELYVGGGYLRVTYASDQVYAGELSTKRYYFPDITGLFNLYDGVTIPGSLEDISIRLKYQTDRSVVNETVFLALANVTIWSDNVSEAVDRTFNRAYLESEGFNVEDYVNTTLPIRFGFENITSFVTTQGIVDALLVTDVSGSMGWQMRGDIGGATDIDDCSSADLNLGTTSRISVAKCADKDFSAVILGYPDNRLGLVAYASGIIDDEFLTDDLTLATSVIDNYDALGGTCICCGVIAAYTQYLDDAETLLVRPGSVNPAIPGEDWRYTDQYRDGSIDPDWYLEIFDDSSWSVGTAPFGFQTPLPLSANEYVTLLENVVDQSTPRVEFTNPPPISLTYGIAGAHDGWDNTFPDGVFDYTDRMIPSWTNQRVELQAPNTGRNVSGAWGISVEITDADYAHITSGNHVFISFNYGWTPDPATVPFNDDDYAFFKARWVRPDGTSSYLGREQYNNDNFDSTPEIFLNRNPHENNNGLHEEDITNLITGPGVYYLELGAKLYRDDAGKRGTFYFDNVQIAIPYPSTYYFRKTLDIDDYNPAYHYSLSMMARNNVDIYVNGNEVLNQDYFGTAYAYRLGRYWDAHKAINATYLQPTNNVIAVKLETFYLSPRFDMAMRYINTTTNKAVMVMSDGEATDRCGAQATVFDWDGDGNMDSASDHAVRAACDAVELTDTEIYTVAFGGTGINELTLQSMAACDNISHYYQGSDSETLRDIYQEIARRIIETAQFSAQIITFANDYTDSHLSGESYIDYEVATIPLPSLYGKLLINGEQTPFVGGVNCQATVPFSSVARPISGEVLSYSGPHWTDRLVVNSHSLYNLSSMAEVYKALGDPFVIGIPPGILTEGDNTIYLTTADDPDTITGCSRFNKLIYTLAINSSLALDSVYPFAEGCQWTRVDFPSGQRPLAIPAGYTGTNTCEYSVDHHSVADSISTTGDAWQHLAFELFSSFDIDNDGDLELDFSQNDIDINLVQQTNIPYMWGPAIMEVTVWR